MSLYYVAGGLIILIGSYLINKKRKENFREKERESQIPDSPIGFGYKNSWLAIKTEENLKIADILNLKVKPINWANGVKVGCSGKTFITPPINGWTLVLGANFEDFEEKNNLKTLKKLSIEFEECQAFSTYRSVTYHAWAMLKEGDIIRAVRYFVEEENPFVVIGKRTAIEESINFKIPTLEEMQNEDYWENEIFTIPDEKMVMTIAESWSINPATLDQRKNLEKLGFISI